MSIIEAIIFGIVEGVTEFLPVSSTGHLILTAKLLGHSPTEFLKLFEVVIQLGAMLSIVVLYGRSLLRSVEVWKRIIAAFLPTAALGAVLYKIVKTVFMESHHIVLWAFFLGGIVLVVFDRLHKEEDSAIDEIAAMPYRTAVIIGLFQALAMVPGVSRSAATIIGGLFFGLKRKTIVEFSFLLALPTMFAATVLDIFKSGVSFTPEQGAFLATGFIVSFIVAIFSVKFLIHYVQRHSFFLFGVYRVMLSAGWWVLGK